MIYKDMLKHTGSQRSEMAGASADEARDRVGAVKLKLGSRSYAARISEVKIALGAPRRPHSTTYV